MKNDCPHIHFEIVNAEDCQEYESDNLEDIQLNNISIGKIKPYYSLQGPTEA